MKRMILGIISILIGLVQVMYFLVKNRFIVLNYFVENHKYTDGYSAFMNVFAGILLFFLIINAVFAFISLFKRKKEQEKILGEELVIAASGVSVISLAFLGIITIICPLSIVGGVIIMIKK